MMGQGLTVLGVALQSVGKVLYGTFLEALPTATFLLVCFVLTAGVCLVAARFRAPRRGLLLIIAANVWTTITFVCFFFALKYLAPASVGAIEVGAAVLAAVFVTSTTARAWPHWQRLVACAGIVGGCVVLASVELGERLSGGDPFMVGVALAASALIGFASTQLAAIFKKLSAQGWSSASVLAHRFYLTIAVAFVWVAMSGHAPLPETEMLPAVVGVGTVAVLLPLLLFQLALRCTDMLTVLISSAAQPVMSFTFALASPAYAWSGIALVGVLTVSAALLLDVYASRYARGLARGGAAAVS